jgi:chromosome segregation ATPase
MNCNRKRTNLVHADTEHRVATLEDSFNALATISKVRALTHNGLLERVNVLGKQQQQLKTLESKAVDADKERFRKGIETSTTTIQQLNSEIERLKMEKIDAEEKLKEMDRIRHLAEERKKNMLALEIQAKEHSIERDVMDAGKNSSCNPPSTFVCTFVHFFVNP